MAISGLPSSMATRSGASPLMAASTSLPSQQPRAALLALPLDRMAISGLPKALVTSSGSSLLVGASTSFPSQHLRAAQLTLQKDPMVISGLPRIRATRLGSSQPASDARRENKIACERGRG